jgi:hypothetical protein
VLLNVSSYIPQIIIGVIILLAVAFDTFAELPRRRARTTVVGATGRSPGSPLQPDTARLN